MKYAKRVTITVPGDLIDSLDAAANAMNLTRSAYIAVAVTEKIQKDEMLKQLPYLVHKLQAEEGRL